MLAELVSGWSNLAAGYRTVGYPAVGHRAVGADSEAIPLHPARITPWVTMLAFLMRS
jgi:hypothetical protein